MIEVTIYKNEKHECVGFKASGHAEYAEEGQDIVCAAASMLIINTINAIDRYTDDKSTEVSDEESGIIEFRLIGRPTREASLLLKTMILGLEDMEENEQYGPYIDIIFEEV
ncbi:MAG TPA: ribosomal-processing cysteine protease Prp [Lachnospiraceae bacterium]|nr:ribosomal-processing cysteine protease Prp [Lachnospiraceae bacterium]